MFNCIKKLFKSKEPNTLEIAAKEISDCTFNIDIDKALEEVIEDNMYSCIAIGENLGYDVLDEYAELMAPTIKGFSSQWLWEDVFENAVGGYSGNRNTQQELMLRRCLHIELFREIKNYERVLEFSQDVFWWSQRKKSALSKYVTDKPRLVEL